MSSCGTGTELQAPSPDTAAEKAAAFTQESWPTKDFGLIPIPKRLQYNPIEPFHFGILLNVSFGFASTFSTHFSVDGEQTLLMSRIAVANLFYCQPLLSR
jgi:hypothetical protein